MPSFLPAITLYLLAGAAAAADLIQIDVIKNPYGGSRNVPELSINPDYIHAAGLEGRIEGWGGQLIRSVQEARLTAEQERQYGEWNGAGAGISIRWKRSALVNTALSRCLCRTSGAEQLSSFESSPGVRRYFS